LLLLLGLGAFFLGRRQAPGTSDWVVVSKAVFTQSDQGESEPTVAFVVSNAGPKGVDFGIGWVECRASSDPNLLPVKPVRFKATNVELPPGAAMNLAFELITNRPLDGQPFFCCQLNWVEHDTFRRRLVRQTNLALHSLNKLLPFRWNLVWWSEPFASGEVLASNLKVADYFNRVHGLSDNNQWSPVIEPEPNPISENVR